MSPTEAIVLGIVQGLTEFLPISSTAHLRVMPALFGWSDPGVQYSAVIQLGSVLAVVTYFWKDLWGIISGALVSLRSKDYGSRDARLLGAILVGTLPICVLGIVLKPLLEQDNGPFRSLIMIGWASIAMAILLFIAEKRARHERDIEQVTGKDGLIMGLGQALALIPGCSRSGSTLTFAMFLNMKREDAARFSFLLGVPAIVLSGLLELRDLVQHGIAGEALTSLIVGFIVSAVVSYMAIAWLLNYLKSHSTLIFVIYRLIFGVTVIALSAASIIH